MSEEALTLLGAAGGYALKRLLRKILRSKKTKEQLMPEKLTKEEIDQYLADTLIEEAYQHLQDEYDKAYQKLLQKEEQVEDPHLKKFIQKIKRYHEMFREEDMMRPSWMLTAILLNEALEKGGTDREKIYQYIIKSTFEYAREMDSIIPKKPYKGGRGKSMKEELRDPGVAIYNLLDILPDDQDDPVVPKYNELVARAGGVSKWGADKKYPSHEAHKHTPRVEEEARRAIEELGIEPFWDKDPEEILGTKPLAPVIAARVLEERLPGAAYRLAALLHATEQGAPLTPEEIEKILEETTAPHSPQGTQHYNLAYHIINTLEDQVSKGAEPSKPSKIILDLIRKAANLKPYQDPERILEEAAQGRRNAEITLIKTRLGLPGRDKRRLAKTLLNLIRLAREIEEGRRDPYHEDAKSELAVLARNLHVEERKPTSEYLQRISPETLEHIHQSLHKEYTEKAIQIGRESAIKTLSKALEAAKEAMKKHTGKPYYQMVADVVREVEQSLRGGGTPEERQEARWASLAIQHLLQTLPIHVAETREELGMAKHLLTQGYNPREYDVPLLLTTLGRIAELGKHNAEERKIILELTRIIIQTAEVTKGVAWRTLQAHREEGRLEPREYIRSLAENIRTVSWTRR